MSNFSSSDEKMCGTIGQSQNGPNLPEGLSVEETFDPWFRQQGYPFLRVSRDGDRGMATSLKSNLLVLAYRNLPLTSRKNSTLTDTGENVQKWTRVFSTRR